MLRVPGLFDSAWDRIGKVDMSSRLVRTCKLDLKGDSDAFVGLEAAAAGSEVGADDRTSVLQSPKKETQ